MYNDCLEYIKYIKEKDISLLEPINTITPIEDTVLNPSLDINTICREFGKNGYVIFDNILKEEYANRLRYFVYNTNIRHDFYYDYAAINLCNKKPFHGYTWFSLLTSIVDEIKFKFPVFHKYEFEKGWAFIHDNQQSRSVGPHLDGYPLTLNIWVTPDDCIETNSNEFNGIVVSRAKNLDEFDRVEKKVINYKFNRAMIFNGNNIHYSLKSRFIDGYENRKINYTFLFERIEKINF